MANCKYCENYTCSEFGEHDSSIRCDLFVDHTYTASDFVKNYTDFEILIKAIDPTVDTKALYQYPFDLFDKKPSTVQDIVEYYKEFPHVNIYHTYEVPNGKTLILGNNVLEFIREPLWYVNKLVTVKTGEDSSGSYFSIRENKFDENIIVEYHQIIHNQEFFQRVLGYVLQRWNLQVEGDIKV